MSDFKGPIKVSFDAIAREKSAGYIFANVLFNWTKFGQ